jgi:formylglycine-generating enzyme required for sulfatase activity
VAGSIRRLVAIAAAFVLPACFASIDESKIPGSVGSDGGPGGNDGSTNVTCPSDMAQADGYCIDSTEVTNTAYAGFVNARVDPDTQSDACRNLNTTFLPAAWPYPSGRDSFPVVNVNWCQAAAYCTWANKRLCGRIGGGSLQISEAAAGSGQWFAACSHAGSLRFPYGDSFDPSACNGGGQNGNQDAVAAGSMAGCVGGYPRIFDLSGNVSEWIDACTNQNPGHDSMGLCAAIGGSFNGTGDALSCGSSVIQDRLDQSLPDRGFRCCSP